MARRYLLVGIDTEGDNQWDLQRARTRPSRTSTRCRSCTPVRAPRRAAHVRGHLAGGQRRAVAAGAALPAAARRLRDRRAPSRVGDPAVHCRGRQGPSLRVDAPLDQFEAQLAQLTAAIAAGSGRAAGLVQVRAIRLRRLARGRARALRLSRRSSVAPLFNESHKGGPDFVEAPVTPYFLAYDSPARPGTSQVLEMPVLGGAPSPRAAGPCARLGARAVAVHDASHPAQARRRPARLAAAVVLLVRRDVRTRAPAGARRRARAEPALPLERGHRRRQSVQPHAGRAGRFPRSARSVPAFAVNELGARPATFREFTRYAEPAATAAARRLISCASATSRRTCRPTRPPTPCCPTTSGAGRVNTATRCRMWRIRRGRRDLARCGEPARPRRWIPPQRGGWPDDLRAAASPRRRDRARGQRVHRRPPTSSTCTATG